MLDIQMFSMLFSGLVVGILIGALSRFRRGSVEHSRDADAASSESARDSVVKPSKISGKTEAYLVVGNTLMRLKGRLDWTRGEFRANGRRFLVNPDHIVYIPRGKLRKSWRAAIFLSPEGHSIEYVKVGGEKAVKREIASKLLDLKMYADAAQAYTDLINNTINISTKRMMYAVIAMSIAMIVVTLIQYYLYQAAISSMGDALAKAWEFMKELAGNPPVPPGV